MVRVEAGGGPYQFETECFQLGQDPVEGSLIGEKARQDGIAALARAPRDLPRDTVAP